MEPETRVDRDHLTMREVGETLICVNMCERSAFADRVLDPEATQSLEDIRDEEGILRLDFRPHLISTSTRQLSKPETPARIIRMSTGQEQIQQPAQSDVPEYTQQPEHDGTNQDQNSVSC